MSHYEFQSSPNHLTYVLIAVSVLICGGRVPQVWCEQVTNSLGYETLCGGYRLTGCRHIHTHIHLWICCLQRGGDRLVIVSCIVSFTCLLARSVLAAACLTRGSLVAAMIRGRTGSFAARQQSSRRDSYRRGRSHSRRRDRSRSRSRSRRRDRSPDVLDNALRQHPVLGVGAARPPQSRLPRPRRLHLLDVLQLLFDLLDVLQLLHLLEFLIRHKDHHRLAGAVLGM